MQKVFCYLISYVLSALAASGACSAADRSSEQVIHAQAKDLNYGNVLYELYQGRAFEALTGLNVAKVRGGIVGHHDHPKLIEGSLMLSYGMTHEAKRLFETLLLNDADLEHGFVTLNARNQAWFYLGKILMLEQDVQAAWEAFQNVDASELKKEQVDIYDEWLYLKALISPQLSENKVDKLPREKLTLTQLKQAETRYKKTGDTEEFYTWLHLNGEITKEAAELLSNSRGYIWQAYFRYNLAAESLNNNREEIASQLFTALIVDITKWLVTDISSTAELLALRDQSYLSLAQLYLRQANYSEALKTLKRIHLKSVFSDQALFTYAVAASHSQEFGLALQALNTLKQRKLFSPWRQQTPYALAYLYEQLGESDLALEAYSAAVTHYKNLALTLEEDQKNVTEEKVLQALNLQEGSIEQGLLLPQNLTLELGREHIANDEYGYIEVDPKDFHYAELLATEPFQLSLRNLHELYKLKYSLARWEMQLDSFDSMMATRQQLRKHRINSSLNVMKEQRSDHWIQQEEAYVHQFKREDDAENSQFFMDADQQGYAEILARMTENLSQLPAGEEKNTFTKKLVRMKTYFLWLIDDHYTVNRWAAKKQLISLTRAIDEFKSRNELLNSRIRADVENQALSERITNGRERLSILKRELEQNLSQAREQLLVIVKQELGRQSEETKHYLLAASTAQARIADELFLSKPDRDRTPAKSELEKKEGAE